MQMARGTHLSVKGKRMVSTPETKTKAKRTIWNPKIRVLLGRHREQEESMREARLKKG